MVSCRAKGYAVCGDLPSGNFISYPSHEAADIFGYFRMSSYSKASTSMIAAFPGHSKLAGRLEPESTVSTTEDSCSTAASAKGGLGISETAGGVLVQALFASTLHTHE